MPRPRRKPGKRKAIDPREAGDMPTPEQIMRGDAVREFITHAETNTKAMGYRMAHDPVQRWERDGKLTSLQLGTIERMQKLWERVHPLPRVTGSYSEPLSAPSGVNLCEARQESQIALRDELRAIEAHFDGVRQWYGVFERICRFGISPVEACGDRAKALTIVRVIADFIDAKK